MKILRIYTRLPPLIGGMEKHIAQLTNEQIKLGHDVTIYFNKGDKVSSHDVQVTKYSLYKLKPQFFGLFLFHFLVLIRLLRNKNKFELIHIHGDWSSLVFSKLIKKIVGAEKLILTVHDQLSKKILHKKAFSKLLENVDILFATGYKAASQLNKLSNNKVIVQPSGIQKIFLDSKTRDFNKSSFQIITVANLFKKKNLDLVLDIAKELPLVKFLVIGEGPEKNYLLGRVKNEKLSNIQILGYKNPLELHSLYYQSDVFILTSIKEGTPTAMLEAMACGLPIVATDAGGVKRILGSHNYIADINDKKQFINCISTLIGDTELMQSISVKNITQAKSFSWEYVAQKIDNLILDKVEIMGDTTK